MLSICKQCPLYEEHGGLSQYVPPIDNSGASYALIGEAPGADEVIEGAPFVGASGQEQDQYLSHANLGRHLFHIQNIVQCRPPNNRDPKPAEIQCCQQFLLKYLEDNHPSVIGAVGRFATRFLMGPNTSMEYCHGVPHRVEVAGYTPIVIPIYHPAAGMKSTTLMTHITNDYKALGQAIRRESTPRPWPMIRSGMLCADFPHFPAETPEIVALDTETLPDGSAWCLTYCLDSDVYRGRIIMAGDKENLDRLQSIVANPRVVAILHNALFDLGVLSQMGVHPAKVHDTMVMAYLLQDLPLGLKPLSYRLAGLTLAEYTSVIHEAQQYKALEYLLTAKSIDWPNPEQVLVWEKGQPKVKSPQNISKKITRLLNSYGKDPSVDLSDKWSKIDYDGGRGQVEEALGPMPMASLADAPRDEAVQYACIDAIATYKVYQVLSSRITAMELWDTFDRDMRIIPMLADMMRTGILINKTKLSGLDQTLQIEKDALEAKINDMCPGSGYLKPSSTQQVARALYKLGIYRTPTMSTDAETLNQYRNKHPLIPLISRWRELDKLQTTYLRPLPLHADKSGRIHTKFSNTNTTTGRLASSRPNLQNIPTRSSEGKQIRGAFIASEGCTLLSLDYSQIEMRCVAHMSKDPTMIRMFMKNLDIHSETAARMFKIPLDQVNKDRHRRPAKSIGFGVVYGMGPHKLQSQMQAQGIDYTIEECEELISMWFGVYPQIYEYMDMVKADARRKGLVRDYFGRYRLIPEVMSVHPRIVHAGLRQAGNFPIQAMAQQIIKQAMGDLIPIYIELQEGGRYRCDPLIQIHDELIWEVSDDILPMTIPIIKSVMESAVELCVPVLVDHNTAQSWGDLK